MISMRLTEIWRSPYHVHQERMVDFIFDRLHRLQEAPPGFVPIVCTYVYLSDYLAPIHSGLFETAFYVGRHTLNKKRSTRRALHFREKVFYNNGVIGLGASFEVLRGIMDQDVHGGVISDVAMNGNSLSLTHMPIFLHEAIRRGEVENPYEDIRRISREIPEVQSRGNHVLGPPFYLRPRLEQSNV